MKAILTVVCLLIAVFAGIAMFFQEPLTFLAWVGGWGGWLLLKAKEVEDEPKGKPPLHKPRTRLPSRHD